MVAKAQMKKTAPVRSVPMRIATSISVGLRPAAGSAAQIGKGGCGPCLICGSHAGTQIGHPKQEQTALGCPRLRRCDVARACIIYRRNILARQRRDQTGRFARCTLGEQTLLDDPRIIAGATYLTPIAHRSKKQTSGKSGLRRCALGRQGVAVQKVPDIHDVRPEEIRATPHLGTGGVGEVAASRGGFRGFR